MGGSGLWDMHLFCCPPRPVGQGFYLCLSPKGNKKRPAKTAEAALSAPLRPCCVALKGEVTAPG